MLLEILNRKVGVALHDVHDDRAPGFDVAWLCLIQLVETADDVRAKPVQTISMIFSSSGKARHTVSTQPLSLPGSSFVLHLHHGTCAPI